MSDKDPAIYRRDDSSSYYARLRRKDGTYKRVSTECTEESDAREAARLLQAALDQEEGPGRVLFSVAHDRYVKVADLKPNTIKNYTSSHRVIRKFLGDFTLNTLTIEHVHSYITNRLVEVTPTRVKRDLSYLSSMLNFWVTQPDGPPENVILRLNRRRYRLREGKPRTNWLTPEQFERLLSLTDSPTYRAILILAVETGMRQAEILGLTRQEVDLKRRRIVIGNVSGARTKNSESRIIPLTPRAYEAVSSTLLTHRHYHVFLGNRHNLPINRVNFWYPQLVRKAGLGDFRFHDLRHTFASWASQRGIEERVLQTLLGHKTRSLTQRYSHLRDTDLEEAMTRFTEKGERPPAIEPP